MPKGHILIVEDEEEIADLLRDYLFNEGYTVSWLENGDAVIPHIKKSPPALILLDILLPGTDGTEICREVRKFSKVPIIMLTAKVEEIDRIVGLELGADDYICKPFSPREVLARVKAVLRRCFSEDSGKKLRAGPLFLNSETRQISILGNVTDLTPIEFGILREMISCPGRVFSRTHLIEQVQGYDFDGYERTVDFHIKNLRKKLAVFLPDQEIIVSVYGAGYKLAV
ncbi:MAG: response regulator [Desulfococcaceae bacterium]|jgi:two-component system response regulator BaeR|nr:response regulator [Desulfococcaceae bacterium]